MTCAATEVVACQVVSGRRLVLQVRLVPVGVAGSQAAGGSGPQKSLSRIKRVILGRVVSVYADEGLGATVQSEIDA